MTSGPRLTLDNVGHAWGGLTVLDGIDLTVAAASAARL